ncbi:MAG: hypothetical protein JWQ71_4060, partial [Pedosphaera sp.]|nr:hypothetical protein [Pedosphaera sp.]
MITRKTSLNLLMLAVMAFALGQSVRAAEPTAYELIKEG